MFQRETTLTHLQLMAEQARDNGDHELSDAIAAAIIRVRRSEEASRNDAA